MLGIDGISDFNALYSRRQDEQVQLYAFDILSLDGDDLRTLPLPTSPVNSRVAPTASSSRRSSMARSAMTCSGRRATLGLRAWCRSGPYRAGRSKDWVRVKNRKHPAARLGRC
jgi:ATP-dependent DNA ligase